jgi:two-component system response regulator AtoC
MTPGTETYKNRALVVDDERSSRLNIRDLLTMEQFHVEEAADGLTALKLIKEQSFDVVLLDIRMPKINGLAVLKHVTEIKPNLPVIMFTAFGTSDRAIEAMKIGAFDYIVKPFDVEELLATIRRAVEYKHLAVEVQHLRQRLAGVEGGEFHPDQIVSDSPVMQKVFKMIGRVASKDATVLIEGETGTGKELVANAIWYHSSRKERPFIKVNCAAIPEGLLESELFGHEKGAFTDAHQMRKGHFEMADGGTIFLDEIAEMSSKLQSKLLRVLEQHEFQRVGGKHTVRVDVRIVAATNKDLQEETKAGRFRKDLLYRLQVVHIVLPPLRERKRDIPALVNHFLKKFNRKGDLLVSSEALKALEGYSWPGNVRELGNIIERATVLTQGKLITTEHLSLPTIRGHEKERLGYSLSEDSLPLRTILADVEREVITEALQRTNWNKSKAAKLLHIDRRVLFDKIKEYDLHP